MLTSLFRAERFELRTSSKAYYGTSVWSPTLFHDHLHCCFRDTISPLRSTTSTPQKSTPKRHREQSYIMNIAWRKWCSGTCSAGSRCCQVVFDSRHWLAILCLDTYLSASVPRDNALAIKAGSLVLLITMDAWCCVFTLKLSMANNHLHWLRLRWGLLWLGLWLLRSAYITHMNGAITNNKRETILMAEILPLNSPCFLPSEYL